MSWIGAGRVRRDEVVQAPVNNVAQTSNLVGNVTELLKTARGAWSEVQQPAQPQTQQLVNPHQPIYQQKK